LLECNTHCESKRISRTFAIISTVLSTDVRLSNTGLRSTHAEGCPSFHRGCFDSSSEFDIISNISDGDSPKLRLNRLILIATVSMLSMLETETLAIAAHCSARSSTSDIGPMADIVPAILLNSSRGM